MVAAWSVDRLGRSLTDLLDFLRELHAKGVDLFLHQQGLTSTRYVRIRASAISRRTSSWLEEQGQRPAMQRAGTLRYMGPPRPGPLLNRPRGDKCSEQVRPSQANRGPKDLGRPWGANESTWDKLQAFMLGFQRIVDSVAINAKPYIFDVDRYGRLTRIPIP
jgi:Resolvase, N terminal domain